CHKPICSVLARRPALKALRLNSVMVVSRLMYRACGSRLRCCTGLTSKIKWQSPPPALPSIMRWRGLRLAGTGGDRGLPDFGGEARDLPFQLVDELPLGRDRLIQILYGAILMGAADLQFDKASIERGKIVHGRGSPGGYDAVAGPYRNRSKSLRYCERLRSTPAKAL